MLDPCATGQAFGGWREAAWIAVSDADALRTWPPASWLLRRVADLSVFG